ncbi:hypothetical protein PG994_003507 [Apiospora phragmitis]|uniref:Uncharacterized protein n=1 Tax=Apiospora phragmitis TaxID=2905665 RepID=A0ABR1W1F1_9PEZI
MPEIIQKLKSEIKSGLSSSDDHDDTGNTGAREAETIASPGAGGGIIPADVSGGGGGDPSTTAAHSHSDRQTLRKAAEAGGSGGSSGSDIKSSGGGGVTMTPPSGGVIHSEEAHARDRAGSERMTLRKAAAHNRGGRHRAWGVIGQTKCTPGCLVGEPVTRCLFHWCARDIGYAGIGDIVQLLPIWASSSCYAIASIEASECGCETSCARQAVLCWPGFG